MTETSRAEPVWQRLRRNWHRLWPGLLPFALPSVFYILTLSSSLSLLPPDQPWPAVAAEDFKPAGFARSAHDVEGRFLYGTVTTLTRAVSVGAIGLTLVVLLRRCGVLRGLVFPFIGASLAGMLIGWAIATEDAPLLHVVYAPLQAAEDAGVTMRGTAAKLEAMLFWSMWLGGIAIILFMLASSVLAIRARPEQRSVELLRQRMSDLQLITLSVAALWVVIVTSHKLLLAWPQGLLIDEIAKPFGALANGYAVSTGVTGTLLIACATAPVILSLKADVKSAAAEAGAAGPTAERDWLRTNQLELAPASVLTTILSTAAPMLTSPLIDVAGSLLRG